MLGVCFVLVAKTRMSEHLENVGEQNGPNRLEESTNGPELPTQVVRRKPSNVQDVGEQDVGCPMVQCWVQVEHHSGISIGSPQLAKCEGPETSGGYPRMIQ